MSPLFDGQLASKEGHAIMKAYQVQERDWNKRQDSGQKCSKCLEEQNAPKSQLDYF